MTMTITPPSLPPLPPPQFHPHFLFCCSFSSASFSSPPSFFLLPSVPPSPYFNLILFHSPFSLASISRRGGGGGGGRGQGGGGGGGGGRGRGKLMKFVQIIRKKKFHFNFLGVGWWVGWVDGPTHQRPSAARRHLTCK